MKKRYTMLLLACAVSIQLCAQVTKSIPPATFFDPEHDPIAIRSDTSLLLVVSEYILVKSVTARVGQKCVIDKTYKSTLKNGATAIIFEGHYTGDPGQRFSMGLNLIPDAAGKFFYAAQEATMCEKPGCSNCTLSNGRCLGCCDDAGSNGMASRSKIVVPLLKVQTSID